jgi:hypothetical protein
MGASQILILTLVLLAVPGVLYLFWLDILKPRQERALRRAERREQRRLSRIRSLVWAYLMSLKKTRRLTDQRQNDREK